MLWLFALLACKGPTDTGMLADCDDCVEGEVCVAHFHEDGSEPPFGLCEPVPAECGESLDCSDNTCLLDAYALCEPGFEGGLCSVEEQPTLTCYAETP